MKKATNDIILDSSGLQFNSELAKEVAKFGWLCLWGEIADALCETAGLFLLKALNEKRDSVNFMICSGGGSEDDARGLMGIMDICKSNGMIIKTLGAGMIGSAAFDIFIAGSKGYRFVTELSMLMTHSSSAELRNKREFKLQEYLDEFTLKTYTKIHPRMREKFLSTGDWYISPEEAVLYGIADAVIKIGDPIPEGPIIPQRKHHEAHEDTEQLSPSVISENENVD